MIQRQHKVLQNHTVWHFLETKRRRNVMVSLIVGIHKSGENLIENEQRRWIHYI